ncbi:universal stress protein [Marinobacter sp. NP-4(2019)]|uniref:universal stress protein n=1 Tax=Marinobacter sp. NP-4(2019) TaxID=2488665 RepID=UPI0013E08564|nr:universal stress protein [Marinobacter sp. NP-4(2019)]
MTNKFKTILVPLDPALESTWRSALPAAIDLASNDQATLCLMTVVPEAEIPAIAVHLPDGLDEKLRDKGLDALETLRAREVPESIHSRSLVGQGRIDKQILRMAAKIDADLIVMASHRPKATDYLISAIAAYVTRHAKSSVMVVRERNEDR